MSDTSFLDYVIEQLEPLGGVTQRAMFGGHGLYARGSFFGIVHKGALYFRTDEASRAKYKRAGSRPFNPKGKQELHRYYAVPAEVLDDAETLVAWAREAAERG
ncbi:MAG TPA: TfoX/Sxy family protein [Gammaproteobacteria bacterium]|nr:TfoX/Sxy family protein [Gammaproteobacteria bacterium]